MSVRRHEPQRRTSDTCWRISQISPNPAKMLHFQRFPGRYGEVYRGILRYIEEDKVCQSVPFFRTYLLWSFAANSSISRPVAGFYINVQTKYFLK